MNAIYRPGPMANIPTFVANKYSKKPIQYDHMIMATTLKTTFGILIYQEQVMQLVQDMAGFSLAEADVMRRAMGKKKVDEMNKLTQQFITGCQKKGLSEELAKKTFNTMLEFTKYAFNKSHGVVYAYLAFQDA